MKNRVLLMFAFFLPLVGCAQESLKCDYISTSTIRNKKTNYSIVQSILTDTLKKEYYARLDSVCTIENKVPNFIIKESFSSKQHKLYGVITLKIGKEYLGETWRSPYEENNYDSLNVTLQNIIDTVFSDMHFSNCCIYYIQYNKYSMNDVMDYQLYFDTENKIVLQKIYYQGTRVKGTEELIRVQKL